AYETRRALTPITRPSSSQTYKHLRLSPFSTSLIQPVTTAMAPQERKKSQRQQTLKDMSKWNNEDGTALSEKRRKKDLEAELCGIPGYEFVKALVSASSTTPQHASGKTSDLYKKTLALLTQLDSQAEDNDDPFHAAFSGWRPSSLNDVGYRDGLKMFATLWKRLQHVTSVPEVTLCARKAYLCAAAEHIHAILLPEGLVDLPGPDQLFLPDQDEDGEGEDLRMEPAPEEIKAAEVASKKKNKRRKLDSGGDLVVKSTFSSGATSHALPGDNDSPSVTINPHRAVVHYFFHSVKWKEVPGHLKPKHKEGDKYLGCNHCSTVLRSSVASNGNTKTLCNHLVENHGRTVAPLFRLLKEKRKSCMEITEEELQKAAGTIPIGEMDGVTSKKKSKGIDDILSRAMEKYNTQCYY
ncbi:hypothetical protein BT69DRAFT_1360694, partial [Atractiella rhizophila]